MTSYIIVPGEWLPYGCLGALKPLFLSVVNGRGVSFLVFITTEHPTSLSTEDVTTMSNSQDITVSSPADSQDNAANTTEPDTGNDSNMKVLSTQWQSLP
jgi:hypothetical protein